MICNIANKSSDIKFFANHRTKESFVSKANKPRLTHSATIGDVNGYIQSSTSLDNMKVKLDIYSRQRKRVAMFRNLQWVRINVFEKIRTITFADWHKPGPWVLTENYSLKLNFNLLMTTIQHSPVPKHKVCLHMSLFYFH